MPAQPDKGRWLAAIPVFAGVVAVALMMPRRTAPADVPLPVPDLAKVHAEAMRDDATAADRTVHLLPPDVRALGTAIRDLHTAEAEHLLPEDIARREATVSRAYAAAKAAAGDDQVRALRATQLHLFLQELSRFEKTGDANADLLALSGTFRERVRDIGWIRGTKLLLSDDERRVLFKQAWNATLHKEDDADFMLQVDETRVLYALYLSYPLPAEDRRRALAKARSEAHDETACRALAESESMATEELRMKRVTKLATLDPEYPAAYARGVIDFRRGRFDLAAADFETWIHEHPEGPWTTRAKGHLLASLAHR